MRRRGAVCFENPNRSENQENERSLDPVRGPAGAPANDFAGVEKERLPAINFDRILLYIKKKHIESTIAKNNLHLPPLVDSPLPPVAQTSRY